MEITREACAFKASASVESNAAQLTTALLIHMVDGQQESTPELHALHTQSLPGLLAGLVSVPYINRAAVSVLAERKDPAFVQHERGLQQQRRLRHREARASIQAGA